jgi:hypothetical protein
MDRPRADLRGSDDIEELAAIEDGDAVSASTEELEIVAN